MKVSDIWTLFGAIIVLAAIGVVARKPQVVTGTLTQFNAILGTATRGGGKA